MALNSFIIPKTVPNRPTIGETLPIRLSHSILRKSPQACSCSDSARAFRIRNQSPRSWVTALTTAMLTKSFRSAIRASNFPGPNRRIISTICLPIPSGRSFLRRMVKPCSAAKKTITSDIGKSTNQTIGPPDMTNCLKNVCVCAASIAAPPESERIVATITARTAANRITKRKVFNKKLLRIVVSRILYFAHHRL